MEADKENNRKQKGRKPKANRAIHRYGIKLNDDENEKFNSLGVNYIQDIKSPPAFKKRLPSEF